MKKVDTIWVIDDDDIHQFFAKKSLDHLQISRHVLPFLYGEDALTELKKLNTGNEQLPDIIFLDINMPRMDGWEFMDEFSRIKPKIHQKIIIFIVSSSIAESDRQKAMTYPEITDFLIKPISPGILAELFAKIPD